MPSGSDGYDCFRELIQELRREHFDEVAGRIDSILNHVAWTTSSELVGELGAAIRDFERAQPVVSPSLRSALNNVRGSWFGFGQISRTEFPYENWDVLMGDHPSPTRLDGVSPYRE